MKSESNETTDKQSNPLREWVSKSPIAAFVVIAAAMFLAKALSEWLFLERLPMSENFEPLVEFVINAGIVLPVLLFLFVLPTARNIRRREATERALRAMHDQLEHQIRERTMDLVHTNSRLQQEVEERRRVQQAVEFQASLLDVVREAVIATDGEGRVLYWNRFAEQLYGWSATTAMGSRIHDIIRFYHADEELMDILSNCNQEIGFSGEVDAVRRDGERFPAFLLCSPLPAETAGYIYLSFDFTERKAAEEALRDSEEKYSNLVENSPTGIFIFRNDKFVYVNSKFAELLEYSREELIELDAWQHMHPDDRERVMQIARLRLAGKPAPFCYECRMITKTGQVRWVRMCNTLIRHLDGAAVIGNVQDMTDRNRLETELRQLSARLLTIQEEERHRVARELHDSLGQKLTGIKFMVEGALGAPWSEERRSGIQRLRSLIPTIQEAVEEVRSISTALRPAILDDLGLLPTLSWYFREFAKAHPGIEIALQIQADESNVPDRLRTPIFRIIQEATNNLAKHSAANHMTIELRADEPTLRLGVRDDGVGFDPKTIRETDKRGTGLSSMRERAELTGGVFHLVSVPGTGTEIQVDWQLDKPLTE